MAQERLQKIIQAAGKASRREAEELIVSGRVSVNGKTIKQLGAKADSEADVIRLDGKALSREEKRVFLFHKPRNVTSTLRDRHAQKTLAQYLKLLPVRTFPVGRLDRDASGLLLVTNDGDFAAQLLHPRYEVPRVYWALVRGRPGEKAIQALLRGVMLEDGLARALEVRTLRQKKKALKFFALKHLPPGEEIVELTVAEGRKHFVKRLLAACGHPVMRLFRASYGPYKIGELEEGEFQEVERLPLRYSSGPFSALG